MLFQQIAFLHCFVPEDLIGIVSFVINEALQLLRVVLENPVGFVIKQVTFSVSFFRKVVNIVSVLLDIVESLAMEILDQYSCCKNSVVRMDEVEVSKSFSLVLHELFHTHVRGEALEKFLLNQTEVEVGGVEIPTKVSQVRQNVLYMDFLILVVV